MSHLWIRQRLRTITADVECKAEEQTHLLTSRQSSPIENYRQLQKLMNGRDGTTAFLPLDSRIGGQGGNDKPSVGKFLTREQMKYIYRKVETGK